MDTSVFVCEIKCGSQEITSDQILKMGDVFSGSIYYNDSSLSWIQFKFVNKEKMSYILSDINDNPGARFEIQVYAKDSKNVQRQSGRF